ncbi:MAG: MFS transporter [Fimbriimonadaceae bacterium]
MHLADDLPHVPSPFEGRTIRAREHIGLSIFWFATNFLWGAMLFLVIPEQVRQIIPDKQAEALGLVLGIGAVAALVVPLIVGPLSDRCSHPMGRRRPYMIWGVALNVLGLAGMLGAGEAKNIWLFGLAFVVVQTGNNMATTSYAGVIPDLIPYEQRGTASGYMAMASQAGTLVGILTTGPLLVQSGTLWGMGRGMTLAYGLQAAVLVAFLIMALPAIPERPLPHRLPKIQWGPTIRSLWIDPVKYSDFAWVWITRALVMMGFYSVMPFVQNFMRDVIHVPNPIEMGGNLIGLALVTATISSIFAGRLSDRTGRKPIVYVATGIMTVACILLALCGNFMQAMLVGGLFGLGYGAYVSVDWALGTDVLPDKREAAKQLAVWHIAMTLPQSLASPIAGLALGAAYVQTIVVDGERTPVYGLMGYYALFGLCAIYFVLGGILLRHVRAR